MPGLSVEGAPAELKLQAPRMSKARVRRVCHSV